METPKDPYPNIRTGSPLKPPFYIKKKEAYSPDWVDEWDRVQEMRRTKHPLVKGGKNNGIHIVPIYHFRHENKFSQRKFHSMNPNKE